MNTSFMRLLAQRLEHLSRTEVVPGECRSVEFFDSLDGFFMSGDLRYWDRPPGFNLDKDDCLVGQIEDWAVQLIQEQHGYYIGDDEEEEPFDNWVDVDMNDELNRRDAWLLACRALGLGDEEEDGEFALNRGLAYALLHPSNLFGRMGGVTPRMAAKVLRLCADGLRPLSAWAMIEQQLRESRLRELAGVLEGTEAGVPFKKVTEWTHNELAEKLTHISMEDPYWPWVMEDGRWCGGIALWACRLYGATADLSFGPIAARNVVLVSSTILGLTGMEGLALFEARLSPAIQGGMDSAMFRKTLTPEMASEVLRSLAKGAFPSDVWDDIYHCPGLRPVAE